MPRVYKNSGGNKMKVAVGTGVHAAGPACPGKARGKQGACPLG